MRVTNSFASKHRQICGNHSWWSVRLWSLIGILIVPGIGAAESLDRLIQIDVPANSRLEDALIDWGTKTGTTVMVNTQTVEGKVTREVKGTLAAGKALSLLLSDSGLSYTEEGDRIRIVPKAAIVRSVWKDERTLLDSAGPSESAARASGESPINDSSAASIGGRDEQGGIQQVLVTAERREESVSRVPISITAMNQQMMDDLQIKSVTDLATVVPGVNISPPSSYQDHSEIAVRGIYSAGNAPTTQIYIDETPIAIRELGVANSKTPFPNIFDLDRVEVLRGPQGTLFGASAMGGAIRFVTPLPSLRESNGFTKADLSYTQGGQPSYEVGAAYGAPIVTGTAGFRVSGWFQSLGGFIDREDGYTGQLLERNANYATAFVVRPSFSVQPLDDLRITAAFFWQRQHSHSPNAYWATELPAPEQDNHVWGGIDQPATDDLRLTSLSVKYAFSNLTLEADTSYLDRKSNILEDTTHLWEAIFDQQPLPPGLQNFAAYEQNNSKTNAWQEEIRLSGNAESLRLNWVAGLFWRKATQTLQQLQPPDFSPITEFAAQLTSPEFFQNPDYVYNGQVMSQYGYYRTIDESTAAFGDVAVDVLPRLKLDIGVRVEHLRVYDQSEFVSGIFGLTSFTAPDVSSNPVTPRLSFTYQMTDYDMVYANAAKGYRPGGANNLAGIVGNAQCTPSLNALGFPTVPENFRADSLWSYEIGTKDSFFDRHVSIDASVYWIKWANIQTITALPSCANQITINQGQVISKGFDLQVSANITPEFSLRAQVGYTDAYYPHAAYGLPVEDANGVLSAPPLINDAGAKLPNVIPWTASASAEYKLHIDPIWSGAQSYFRVDYRWFNSTNANPSRDPNVANYDPEVSPFPNPAYAILNLRVGMLHDGLDLSVYVNNITNSDPVLGYAHDIFNDPLFYGNALRPLTYGITGWYRF